MKIHKQITQTAKKENNQSEQSSDALRTVEQQSGINQIWIIGKSTISAVSETLPSAGEIQLFFIVMWQPQFYRLRFVLFFCGLYSFPFIKTYGNWMLFYGFELVKAESQLNLNKGMIWCDHLLQKNQ